MYSGFKISDFITKNGFCLLDGGLATELEGLGYDLNHPLWSARILMDHPEAIINVHKSFLESGADCITTSSYQISYQGGYKIGLSEKQVTSLLNESVHKAVTARRQFSEDRKGIEIAPLMPLVAASIGPYGAYLADGSEYTGTYGIDQSDLYEFHEKRWEVLVHSEADLMACETIPSFDEALVLDQLIKKHNLKPSFVSFCCKDGLHISDGTPIKKCAALLHKNPGVVAIGVNCTNPAYILSLIKNIREGAPGKEIVVYPNSGEQYDPKSKSWSGICSSSDFAVLACKWFEAGARVIGGCCRTGPEHIKSIRELLNREQLLL